jgi:hypothetical protein
MRCLVEARGPDTNGRAENQTAEEQFLEQFAAIEDGLALVQIQMCAMAENARLFGELAERIRASTYGAKGERQ